MPDWYLGGHGFNPIGDSDFSLPHAQDMLNIPSLTFTFKLQLVHVHANHFFLLDYYFDLPDFVYHKDDTKEMDRDTETGQGGKGLLSCTLSLDKRSSVAHHNELV